MRDTLKAPFRRIVKYEQAKDCLQKISRKNVFLLTDREETAFELTAQEVLELYRDCEDLSKTPSELNLPEDIYVFDSPFDWILVFTHEWFEDEDTMGSKLCFSNLFNKN